MAGMNGLAGILAAFDELALRVVMNDSISAEKDELMINEARIANFSAGNSTPVSKILFEEVTFRNEEDMDMVVGEQSGDPNLDAREMLRGSRR